MDEIKKRKPKIRELGATGRAYAQRFQQFLDTDEYLSALRFPNDIAIYEKMARSDGQVKAILLMLSLPIRATQWFVRPADDSSKAKEISEFVNDCLFGGYGIGLNTGFDEFIKNVTTMFQFGHSVFEKVFEVKKGKLKWKKFAVRPQSTIYEIYYDSAGDCKGIDQYKIKDNWETVYIPIEKMLFFSHEMQQGNVRGSSVLRSAYKHWTIKDFLYKITNVGIERNYVGTPVLNLPEGYTQDDMDLADEIVTTLRSHQFGGVRMPAGFELNMFEGKRTLTDVLPYIDHQNEMISKCILSQFMNLGTGSAGGGGSFALSSDQSRMFLMMLDSSAKNIANVINTHAIPELVNYNFASDLYPKLSFKPMNSANIINTLKTLVDGKIVIPDDDLETYIRDMLDFPDANPVQTRQEAIDQFKIEKQAQFDNSNNQLKTADKKNPDMTKSKNPIDNKSKQGAYKDKIKEDSITKKMSESFNFKKLSLDNLNKLTKLIDKQVMSLNEKAETMNLESLSTIKVQHKGELTKLLSNILVQDFKLSESDIKFLAKCNILSNTISELVKSTFLDNFIDNTITDVQKLTSEIIRNL